MYRWCLRIKKYVTKTNHFYLFIICSIHLLCISLLSLFLFLEITIGVAFHNDTLGWTSQASGSSYPQIVRTEDGGTTWKKVNTSASFSIVTAIAASKSNIDVQVFGVPFTSEYSNDGNNFHPSSGIPIAGQDVKSCTDGRMIMAGPSGVCVSKNMGKDYTCRC